MTIAKREVRVFISSTFKDMQEERRHLVSQVFPELRARCRARGVGFVEVDLRWGITEAEAQNGGSVAICLKEIDRARPYFIGLLGERYGWTPDLDKDCGALLNPPDPALPGKLEQWLREGCSITEIEMLHGVLETVRQNEQAFFYLRHVDLTRRLIKQSEGPAQDFEDGDPQPKHRLDALKARLLDHPDGWQCRAAPYASIEQLGEWIRDDLWRAIDVQFPPEQEPDALARERRFHAIFADSRLSSYVPPLAVVEEMQKALTWGARWVVVTGESGSGKSSLLAYLVGRYRERYPQACIIGHYVGAGGAIAPSALVRRLMGELKAHFGWEDSTPTEDQEVLKQFPEWLARASAKARVLLVLDALNQLSADAQNLAWLPSFVPPRVQILCSTLPGVAEENLARRVESADYPTHQQEVAPLAEERREIIRQALARFRKKLTEPQIERLLATPATQNPLYLTVLLEELRLHGRFETLDQVIDDYLQAPDPSALFEQVLQRLEVDHGAETVALVMRLLALSRRGLSEDEVRAMAGLSPLAVARLRQVLDFHLVDRDGLLDFAHSYLRQAVTQRYLGDAKAVEGVQGRMVGHFAQQSVNARQAEELPWQLSKSGQICQLRAYLREWPVFELITARDEYELLGYWRQIGDDWETILNGYYPQISGEHETAETLNKLSDFIELARPVYLTEPLRRYAVQLSIQQYGDDHPETARCINCLADLLRKQGCYEEAEPLFRQAVAIHQRVLGGEEHPDTAESVNNLALLLSEQGRSAEAEPLCRQALSIRQRVLGEEHPDTAESFNNLALLLSEQGRYAEAEPLYRQALAIDQRVLGEEHPDTAFAFDNLASLLSDQGRYAEAEPLQRQAVAIRQRVLGEAHPDTATSFNNLAVLLGRQGRYAEAEPLYRQALAINQRVLGEEHPGTATSFNNLAGLLWDQGRYAEAEPLYRQALAIRQRVLGEEHPGTTTSFNNLAVLLSDQGRYAEAEPLYRQALAIRQRVLGEEHPGTTTSFNNLAVLLSDQGRYAEAEPLYRQALAIRQRVLGEEHPHTAASFHNLAGLLSNQDRYAEAEPLYRQALAIRQRVLGEEHPDTATSFNNLAVLLKQQGRYVEAEPLYRQALAICQRVLGEEHPDTATSFNNLANLLSNQGRYVEAESLYRQTLAICQRVLGEEHPRTESVFNDLARLLAETYWSWPRAPRWRACGSMPLYQD